jgi:hypothetical protein
LTVANSLSRGASASSVYIPVASAPAQAPELARAPIGRRDGKRYIGKEWDPNLDPDVAAAQVGKQAAW